MVLRGAEVMDGPLLLLVAVILVIDVVILRTTWRSGASIPTKAIWSGILVALPFVGAGLWIFAGPKFQAPERDRPI